MYREEVVTLMTDTINKFNRNMAQTSGISFDQIETIIEQQQDQLNNVNGMLYDVLKFNGVIL